MSVHINNGGVAWIAGLKVSDAHWRLEGYGHDVSFTIQGELMTDQATEIFTNRLSNVKPVRVILGPFSGPAFCDGSLTGRQLFMQGVQASRWEKKAK